MIGVLGGTFDPIHFGHLRPALDCLQALRLDEVRFVPLRVAVHRQQPVASVAQRLRMVRAALAGVPGLTLDAREVERPGRSYTYDTLRALREDAGPARPLCLMIGADAFAGFASWRRPLEILELAHLIVMQRPGHAAVSTTDAFVAGLRQTRECADPGGLAAAPAGRIFWLEATQLAISSTRIRDLIGRGLSPRFLLPDAVLEIIEHEGLYRHP